MTCTSNWREPNTAQLNLWKPTAFGRPLELRLASTQKEAQDSVAGQSFAARKGLENPPEYKYVS